MTSILFQQRICRWIYPGC